MQESRPSSLLALTAVLLFTAAAGAQERRAVANKMAAPGSDPLIATLPANQILTFGLTVPLRNQQQLKTLLKVQNDPSSPRYHQFLSAKEFSEQFGPTTAEYDKVITYAKVHGFTVIRTFPNRLLVNVSGSAASVASAFHVTMQNYKLLSENRTYRAPDVEPTVEATAPILSVEGLSTRNLPHSMLKHSEVHADTTGSWSDGSFLGSDMRAAYASGVTLDGAGQTVGLVELGPYNASDVQSYFKSVGQTLKVPIYNVLLSVDGICTSGCDDGEEVIDIQQAISMAPGLSGLIVYEAYGSGSDALAAFTQAASDDVAKQLSLSFGWGGTPETEPGYEQVFEEFAAQGQNLFIASGDSGANAGGGGYPGNSPNVTDVGGTDLTTAGAGGAWVSETAWVGSGGGWNTSSPIPAYQVPVINSANQGSPTYRNVPDVAMEANTDNYFCANGGCFTGVGGTSLAAPRWAGFLALANEEANGGSIGFLNEYVYALGQQSYYTNFFHDITVGNTFNSDFPSQFLAVAGYDLTTGWGSPNGQSILGTIAGFTSSAPNFTLSASPDAVNLRAGQNATATITVTPTNGFAGAVTLAAAPIGAPPGVTATLDTLTIPGNGQATLSVATASGTPPGNQLVAVTATGGGLSHIAYLRLALPDFALGSSSNMAYLNQAGYALESVSVNSINEFNGSVALSVSGLPTEVESLLWPASTTTSSELLMVALPTAVTTSGQAVSLAGTSGGTTRVVPSLTLAVSAATGTCGSGKPVDLSSVYNLDAIKSDGSTFNDGGLDGDGYAFSTTLLNTARVLNGTRFTFGKANALDAVYGTGQAITLPAGRFVTLQLLATGLNGAQSGQQVVVTYADGSTSTFTQTFSDWYVPGDHVDEQEAVAMQYRDTASGGKDARQFNLYGYTFVLDSTKIVKSLMLPANRNVVVLGVSLGTRSVGTPVSIASSYNAVGIHTDGEAYSDSGLDGGGFSYSANLLGDTAQTTETIDVGDAAYRLGKADVLNAVSAAGQIIALPHGNYVALRLLGTGVQGDQADQPMVVTYSDGSTEKVSRSFSDWGSFSENKAESLAIATAYRNYADGSQDSSEPFNVYGYQVVLNPLKTVVSVKLPDDSDVVLLGMTLVPIPDPAEFACYL